MRTWPIGTALCLAGTLFTGGVPALAEEWAEDGALVVYSAETINLPEASAAPRPAGAGGLAPVPFPRSQWLGGAGGYAKATAAQGATGEPFVLYVYTDWCPYCKVFKRDILNSKRFDTAFRDVIKVRIDGDRDKAIQEKYGVKGYPTFLVVFKDGTTRSVRHDLSVKDFIAECERSGVPIRKLPPTVSLGVVE